MLRDLFKLGTKADDVCHQLVAGIVSRMGDQFDLGTTLEILAEALANLPGHTGAMMIAFDSEGTPFCYRCSGISLGDDTSPFSILAKLRGSQLDESYHGADWTEVSPELVRSPHSAGIAARFLRGPDRESSRGMILIAYRSRTFRKAGPRLPASDEALRFLEWTLHSAIQFNSMKLQADLHGLAADRLSGEQLSIDAQGIADHLCRILNADAVTLVVNRLGQQFLSGTTDAELKATGEAFTIDADLTKIALEKCQSIRLRDATDTREIAKHLSTGTITAKHLEAITHSGLPYRLLVVPMRAERQRQEMQEYAEKVTGAIRILRNIKSPPFTREEERTLQKFANLLGAELDASWILQIYVHIRRAKSEAICISRSLHHPQRLDKKGEGEPTFVYVNLGAQILFGLDSEKILDKPARKLYASDVEYERIRQLLRTARAAGETEYGPIVSKVRSANGQLTPVSISFRFVEPHLKPSAHYTVAVIRDISEQHRLTEQHNRLMELLNKRGVAYFLAGEDGKTIEPTNTDSRLTGYSIDELKEMPRERLYGDAKIRHSLLAQVRRADGNLVRTLQHLKRKDGTMFFAEGVIHLLKDDDHLVGYEGLYEDVSDRIRLQGFLDAKTDGVLRENELFERLKANAEFHLLYTKGLVHQLRAPLAAILHTLLNMQERLSGDKNWNRRLKYAIGQARTWRRLIENLAFMDKLLRGEDFPFEPINLAKLAIETRVDFQYVLPEKTLQVHVDDGSIDRLLSSGTAIWGNEGLFRQAIVNLIDNAVKYSRPGTEIKVRGYEAGMQGRVLEISNQGIGIPKDERDNIFLRGYRTKKAQDSTPDGFGIGLWLVRKIVEAHGARIRCDETLDRRTVFRIYFPYEAQKRSIQVGD